MRWEAAEQISGNAMSERELQQHLLGGEGYRALSNWSLDMVEYGEVGNCRRGLRSMKSRFHVQHAPTSRTRSNE